ncbi:unnamed protein product, partial [Closterium sp. NIES-53]
VAFYDAHKVAALSGVLSSELGFMDKAVTDNVTRDRGLRSICEVVSTLAILFVIAPDLAPVFSLLAVGISLIAGIYKRGTLPVFARSTATQARITDSATETFQAIRTCAQVDQRGADTWLYIHLPHVCLHPGRPQSPNGAYCSCHRGGRGKGGKMGGGKGGRGEAGGCILGMMRESGDWGAGDSGGGESGGRVWGGAAAVGDFAYPQRAAVEVIKGINLVLPRGSVTALVGGSGAGKSTVVQLLSQFYEVRCGVMRCGAMGHGPSLHRWFTEGALVPVAGTISLAGMDIASFDRTQWTRAISLVSQEPVLFAMSVRDNIAYGLPDADVSEADVIRAAKAANAHEFIVKLPQVGRGKRRGG